jgi:hypothetical protein
MSMFEKYSDPWQSTMRCAYKLLSPMRMVTSENFGSPRKDLLSFEVEGLYMLCGAGGSPGDEVLLFMGDWRE